MQLLNTLPRDPKLTKDMPVQKGDRNMSPHENPYLKDLLGLERLTHQRDLQHPKRGDPQNSLLLALPPELRNAIYSMALVCDDPIPVDPDTDTTETEDRYEPDNVVVQEPGLLRICQFMRNEASKMYYSTSTFYALDYKKMLHWIQGIGPEKSALLEDVRVRSGRGECLKAIDTYVGNVLSLLLVDLEGFETALKDQDARVGKGVCRVYRSINGPQISLTRTEIRVAMDSDQWRVYKILIIIKARNVRNKGFRWG